MILIIILIAALLPYILIIVIYLKFQHIINKIMDFNKFLKYLQEETSFDEVDTPAEAITQANKREILKKLINSGQGDRLPAKTTWSIKRLDEASDKNYTMNCM